MSTNKVNFSKSSFYIFLVYYIFDSYLAKAVSTPFIFGLKYGAQFDWVSMGGIFAILHLILLFLELPVIFFFYRAHRWAQRMTLLYVITATIFYGFLLYCIFASRSSFTFFDFETKVVLMGIFNALILVYLVMNFIANSRKHEGDIVNVQR